MIYRFILLTFLLSSIMSMQRNQLTKKFKDQLGEAYENAETQKIEEKNVGRFFPSTIPLIQQLHILRLFLYDRTLAHNRRLMVKTFSSANHLSHKAVKRVCNGRRRWKTFINQTRVKKYTFEEADELFRNLGTTVDQVYRDQDHNRSPDSIFADAMDRIEHPLEEEPDEETRHINYFTQANFALVERKEGKAP